MIRDIAVIFAMFIIMVALQVLLCNNVLLFGVAIPIVFIYFIVRMPIGMNTSLLLTLSFLLGLCVDIFSDTPGLNALSCTLLAMLKRPIFFIYVERDDSSDLIKPGISSIGTSAFAKYLLTLVAIYCFTMLTIEYFSVVNVKEILIMGLASTVLSWILLMGMASLITNRRG